MIKYWAVGGRRIIPRHSALLVKYTRSSLKNYFCGKITQNVSSIYANTFELKIYATLSSCDWCSQQELQTKFQLLLQQDWLCVIWYFFL